MRLLAWNLGAGGRDHEKINRAFQGETLGTGLGSKSREDGKTGGSGEREHR